jgi:hypothetical protein
MELFKYYKIKIKHSNKVFDIKGNPMNSNSEIIQHRDKSRDCDNQKFMIFILDDGCMLIASKQSGKVLGVYKNRSADKTKLIIEEYSGKSNQRFFLLSDKITWPCLRVKLSNKFLEVIKSNISDGAAIVQNRYSGCDNQRFTFVGQEDLQYPVLSNSDVNRAGLKLIKSNYYGEEKTEQILVAEVAIPYLAINELIPEDIQAKASPYYKISRYRYWKKIYTYTFNGEHHESKIVKYNTGIKADILNSMKDVTGICLRDDNKFSFSGFSDDIKNIIKSGLGIYESNSDTDMHYNTEEISISYPKGKPCVITEWIAVDRYTLERANGYEVGEWEIIIASETEREYKCIDNSKLKYIKDAVFS